MKKNIISVTVLLIFCSFISNKKLHSKYHSFQKIATPLLVSTLDSLQGIWISSKDSSYKVIINSNKMYSYYNSQCWDTANIFLTNSCIGSALSLYNTSEVNGKNLILYSAGSANYNFCYTIGYLSDISLELNFEGKLLPFTKQ